MNVAVVAGEASGDRQAANLLRELDKQLAPLDSVQAWGIGGEALSSVGCEIVADSSRWGTIGIVESATQMFSLLIAMRKFKALFLQRRPDLLILVDFGAFNIPLGSWAKRMLCEGQSKFSNSNSGAQADCPIFYYFPPSSWRRKMNVKHLKRLVDVSDIIVTPFPWSEELLRSAGGNAHYLGHPLLDTVQPSTDHDQFDKIYGIDNRRVVITLLPGSRIHEVRNILPVLLDAAGEIARRLPGVQFLVARADNLPRTLIEEILRNVQQKDSAASLLHLAQQAGDLLKHASSALKPAIGERVPSMATPEGLYVQAGEKEQNPKAWAEKRMTSRNQTAPLAIVEHATLEAMSRADLVIATSGTATLEAAILNRPEIIVYRGSSLMNVEYKIRRRALNLKYIGLPNLIAQSMVCPEFIQDDATPRSIADQALELLLQPERLMQMRLALQQVVRENLGEPGATSRTATTVIDYLRARYEVTETNLDGAHIAN
jgi:lipid-A-disaccharide synthase